MSNCIRKILGPKILDLVIKILGTSNSTTFLVIIGRWSQWISFFIYSLMMDAGSKKDLRVFSWVKRMDSLMFFFSFHQNFLQKTCQRQEKRKEKKYTWRAQYNGKLYAAFGKDESFLKKRIYRFSFYFNYRFDDLLHGRGLWFKSRMAQLRQEK